MAKYSKRIYDKYLRDSKYFRDTNDYDLSTKDGFIEYANHKIDYFSKELLESMNSKIPNDKNKNEILCAYINDMLKENIFNNERVVSYDLYTNIFVVEEEIDDSGVFIMPEFYYGNTLGEIGRSCLDEEFRSLIIEIDFEDWQTSESNVFQFRIRYNEIDHQTKNDFELYTKEHDKDFLIDPDWDNDELYEDYHDWISIDIIDLNHYCCINEYVKSPFEQKKMVDDFCHKDEVNLIYLEKCDKYIQTTIPKEEILNSEHIHAVLDAVQEDESCNEDSDSKLFTIYFTEETNEDDEE